MGRALESCCEFAGRIQWAHDLLRPEARILLSHEKGSRRSQLFVSNHSCAIVGYHKPCTTSSFTNAILTATLDQEHVKKGSAQAEQSPCNHFELHAAKIEFGLTASLWVWSTIVLLVRILVEGVRTHLIALTSSAILTSPVVPGLMNTYCLPCDDLAASTRRLTLLLRLTASM